MIITNDVRSRSFPFRFRGYRAALLSGLVLPLAICGCAATEARDAGGLARGKSASHAAIQGIIGLCADGTLDCVTPPGADGARGIRVHHQLSSADCPPATSVRWDAVSYKAQVPENQSGSSRLSVAARFGATPKDFDHDPNACDDCKILAESSGTRDRACGPEDVPCRIELAKLAEGSQPVMELILTLAPTPDGLLEPTIYEWETSYSCWR